MFCFSYKVAEYRWIWSAYVWNIVQSARGRRQDCLICTVFRTKCSRLALRLPHMYGFSYKVAEYRWIWSSYVWNIVQSARGRRQDCLACTVFRTKCSRWALRLPHMSVFSYKVAEYRWIWSAYVWNIVQSARGRRQDCLACTVFRTKWQSIAEYVCS